MFDLRPTIRTVTYSVSLAMLMVGVSTAQVTHTQADTSSQSDVFESVHQALNDAADRTLISCEPLSKTVDAAAHRDSTYHRSIVSDSNGSSSQSSRCDQESGPIAPNHRAHSS
jgi:uncharacterized protein YwlG (UPF0340 family)